jgi:hypothetical protein
MSHLETCLLVISNNTNINHTIDCTSFLPPSSTPKAQNRPTTITMKPQNLLVFMPTTAAAVSIFSTIFPVATETCSACLATPFQACGPESSPNFMECICATRAPAVVQCMGGTTCDRGDDFAAASGWLRWCIAGYKPVQDAYCRNAAYAALPIPVNELTKELCGALPGGGSSSSAAAGRPTSTGWGPKSSTTATVPVTITPTPSFSTATTAKPVVSTSAVAPVPPATTTKPPAVIISGGNGVRRCGALTAAFLGVAAGFLLL